MSCRHLCLIVLRSDHHITSVHRNGHKDWATANLTILDVLAACLGRVNQDRETLPAVGTMDMGLVNFRA